jgi:hypothetical protein
LPLFDFLVWSENFKGSVKKENEVPRAFLSGLFIWLNWELEIKPFKQYFAPLQQPLCPKKLRVEAPSQEAIDGGGEAMRAQDQEDRPHP